MDVHLKLYKYDIAFYVPAVHIQQLRAAKWIIIDMILGRMITVAAQSEERNALAGSNTGIVGSDPTRGMDVMCSPCDRPNFPSRSPANCL
jgi:hypothetical protein